MTEKIVSTHALFIDTASANKESLSRGDDFQLHLNTQSIDVETGQFIRITLNEFCMYKTFTNVNNNNSTFVIKNSVAENKVNLSNKNCFLEKNTKKIIFEFKIRRNINLYDYLIIFPHTLNYFYKSPFQ